MWLGTGTQPFVIPFQYRHVPELREHQNLTDAIAAMKMELYMGGYAQLTSDDLVAEEVVDELFPDDYDHERAARNSAICRSPKRMGA